MTDILHALLALDMVTLNKPERVYEILFILFVVIFLESALLPAAFLPGDSILLLSGVLAAKGILPFWLTMGLLVVATGVGYQVNYLLGCRLGRTQRMKYWLNQAPEHYRQRSYHLLKQYGTPALLISRFIGFVRTLLPLLVGGTEVRQERFHFYNWGGAFLWVGTVMIMGELLFFSPFFQQYESEGLRLLLVLPVVLLFIGGAVSLMLISFRKKG